MDRAVAFYRDAVGLTVGFQSQCWTELSWRDATITLHAGGTGGERASWLGFHVTDLDAAVADVEAAGGRRGKERTEGDTRPLDVVDPEGNTFSLGHDQGPS